MRLLVPEGVETLEAWLGLLEAVEEEVGRVPLAFQAQGRAKDLLKERGYALVNEAGGPLLYLLDPAEVPEGEGFAYFTALPGGPTLGEEAELA